MSTLVVCAGLDPDGEAAVVALLAVLADAGVPVQVPPRHPPHVTLGAAVTDDVDRVAALAGGVAARLRPVPVALESLGVFPAGESGGGVLWLGPSPDPAHAHLQRSVDSALVDGGLPRALPFTRPGRWVPHVTLARAGGGDVLATAVRAVATGFRPVQATLDRLLVVRSGGAGALAEARLGG